MKSSFWRWLLEGVDVENHQDRGCYFHHNRNNRVRFANMTDLWMDANDESQTHVLSNDSFSTLAWGM